jgi:hypothetical protein
MSVSRRVATLTCIALLAPIAGAQQTTRVVNRAQGSLKGVTEVYLDAKGDEPLRVIVEGEMRKQFPSLKFVEPGTPGALVIEIARGFIERKEPVKSSDSGLGEPGHPVADRFQLRPKGALPEERSEEFARLKDRPHVERECWVFAAVLRPAGDGSFAAVFRYRHFVSRGLDVMAKNFVGKFAKEYRKANPESPVLVASGKQSD